MHALKPPLFIFVILNVPSYLPLFVYTAFPFVTVEKLSLYQRHWISLSPLPALSVFPTTRSFLTTCKPSIFKTRGKSIPWIKHLPLATALFFSFCCLNFLFSDSLLKALQSGLPSYHSNETLPCASPSDLHFAGFPYQYSL